MNTYTLEVVFNCEINNDVTLKEGEPTENEIDETEETRNATYE